MISLMSEARRHAQEVEVMLAMNHIRVEDALQENTWDHQTHGHVIKTALGFASQEDLVMARLLLGQTR